MTELKVRYCKPAPVTLKRWLDANADKVLEFYKGKGYSTDEDNGGFAYDILLRPGWKRGDDFVHTLIEPTVHAMLFQLKQVKPCDCEECKALLKKS